MTTKPTPSAGSTRSAGPEKRPARPMSLTAILLVVATSAALLFIRSVGSEPSTPPPERAPTLLAMTDIEAGISVDRLVDDAARLVEMSEVDATLRHPLAVADLDQLMALARLDGREMVLLEPLAVGEQIRTDLFAAPADTVASAIEVDDARHEVAVDLDPERTGGDMVVLGTVVAALGSFPSDGADPDQTVLISAGVTVTRAQTAVLDPATSNDGESPLGVGRVNTSMVTVTLAVTTDQLERILWAKEFGRIRLAVQGDAADGAASSVQDRWSVLDIPAPEPGARSVLPVPGPETPPNQISGPPAASGE